MTTKNLFFLTIIFSSVFNSVGQITSAKITYERKTNVYKKFKHEPNISNWVKEEDKIKIEFFELHITDSMSLFQPQESELREKNSWVTSKNTVYQNFGKKTKYLIKTMWGEELHLTDSIFARKWQITESNRNIAGYQCRKAIWQANDSTRIYAWFSYDLVPSTGPESFTGLPGTILGLATEDGGIVYFAKKVELIKHDPTIFTPPKKKKIYAVRELQAELKKEYGHEQWFARNMNEHFGDLVK